MNRTTKFRLNLITAICGSCCAFLAACAWADAPTPTARPAAKVKAAWITAARKHNGSGVELSYSVPTTLSAGQAAEVQLRFSNVTEDDASVKITAPAGITLASPSSAAAINAGMALPRGGTTVVSVQVTPSADGLEYLNVFMTQGSRSSAQSIPLQVGSAKTQLKTTNKTEATPSGEKVISLPSQ